MALLQDVKEKSLGEKRPPQPGRVQGAGRGEVKKTLWRGVKRGRPVRRPRFFVSPALFVSAGIKWENGGEAQKPGKPP